MKRLKKRSRVDAAAVEMPRRRQRGNWDRTIYLGILAAFIAGLANYVAGDRLFLRADGLVLQDRSVIGATSLVRVTQVAVRPGQSVREGDLLVRAESLDTVARLAELSMREAELVERGARLRSELALARALHPRAKDRLAELNDRAAMLEALDTSRLVTAARKDESADALHRADMEAATLQARSEGLAAELTALDASRAQAARAVRQLETRYRDGIHRSAADGVVGDKVPAPGEVLNPGDPVVTVYWGLPYVLAYLPPQYVFGISVGDAVTVRAGRRALPGHIQSILPMSAAVPDEFRNAFQVRETRQLARIAIDQSATLPATSTVRITQPWNVTPIREAAESLRDGMSGLLTAIGHAAGELWAGIAENIDLAAMDPG